MSFTGNEDHEISFNEAAKLTLRYRQREGDHARKGGFFGKAAFEALLAQDGCVGIRYYHGIDDKDEKVLVLVGTDENESDLLESTNLAMEYAIPCPTRCGEDNILNS